jgi:alkanesulfonate monooxygenase SsuD/methylene tetrahydromethanopterin reductase-like flavin-dependent oxidoreductase (luciferase family)
VTLGALASATKRVDLGTLVSAVGFRYPSLLAKMASTLDHISHGRLRLAVGAGWYEPEYVSYGIPFPPVARRMRQLREGIQIIRSMWTQDKPSFNGQTYKLETASCCPRPSQPRIWVGGTGEKTLLRIVADLADGWNATGTTAEEYEKKLNILKSYCNEAGRNPEEIERSYYAPGLMARSEANFLEIFRKHYGQYKRPGESFEGLVERVRGSGRSFVGTEDEVTEKISEFRKLGVSYIMFYFPDKVPQGMMKQFAERVVPVFQKR